ncbi:hypothetical protein [Methylobacillus sp.]|uniref:hypothetical protein n=1 Tax=Methylobacillus sp. TaxID=56818 RepID=UPI0012C07E0C|nr:hypothetical protein [Methylobacillus sp.]MPS48530.1 hypothetical protein [Methylobacillus sp.]
MHIEVQSWKTQPPSIILRTESFDEKDQMDRAFQELARVFPPEHYKLVGVPGHVWQVHPDIDAPGSPQFAYEVTEVVTSDIEIQLFKTMRAHRSPSFTAAATLLQVVFRGSRWRVYLHGPDGRVNITASGAQVE